jgi:hypothetical protein
LLDEPAVVVTALEGRLARAEQETTDVYFDRANCRGADFGDIVRLAGV